MSPYYESVEQQYLDRLQGRIADFARDYKARRTDRRTTIFLFPGGFASQLFRADQAADQGPPYDYDHFWLGLDFLFGGLKGLEIDNGGDTGSRFIVPDGYVHFFDLGPYNGFADWCEANGIDLFVLGWDWRRSGQTVADFFLDKVLPAFERGVADCQPSPLDNFWLVGHSFGGIIAKHVLNRADDPYVRRLKGAITVGTPFYGYGGQQHRFFIGDPDLNLIGGGADDVTRIGSSLPASYELLFLDGPTYDANADAFRNDPLGYALTDYPSMDGAIAGERADPYNPVPGRPSGHPAPGGDVRYLSGYGFDWDLLSAGHKVAQAVSQPLAASVAEKLWNIRGVQTEDNNPKRKTVVGHTWRRAPPNFRPDRDFDPVKDVLGPGDGVIPAWSARLLGNPRVTTIPEDGIEHMLLMNHRRVQETIADILAPPEAHGAMVATARTAFMPAVLRADFHRFVAEVGAIESHLTAPLRKARFGEIAARINPGDANPLHKFMTRMFVDLLKSPEQKHKPEGD